MRHLPWIRPDCAALFCFGLALAAPTRAAAAPPAAKADAVPAGPVSTLAVYSELEAIGVNVYRVRYSTPGASMSFEAMVDPSSKAGKFVQAECVVLRDAADMTSLEIVDASPALSEKVARRNSSEKTDATFLVLGREVTRAYLVFEFSNAGKPNQRYLLPVTSVPKHRA